jgi:hypothetical protein
MPYLSAHDLPKFVEMSKQLQSLKLLTLFRPKRRAKIKELESRLRFMGDTVDKFYAMLGSRNWIFHESLPLDEVADWLETASPDEVERNLIAYYRDRDTLQRTARMASGLLAMRRRVPLVQLAVDDHVAGRYYAVVHVLLSVRQRVRSGPSRPARSPDRGA